MDLTTNLSEIPLDDITILTSEITRIKNKIDRFTNDLVFSLESKYLRLSWSSTDDLKFDKIEGLTHCIDELLDKLSDEQYSEPSSSTAEIDVLCNDLKQSKIAYDYAKRLVGIRDKIEEISLAVNSFYRRAQLAQELRALLSSKQEDSFVLDIFECIKNELETLDSHNYGSTVVKWESLVVMSVFQQKEHYKTVTLSVNESQKSVVEDVLNALCVYNVIEERVAQFSAKFLREVIKPCVDYRAEIKTKRSSVTLNIEPNCTKTAEQALDDVRTVLDFLRKTFSFQLTNENNFAVLVGKTISEDLQSYIVQQQLDKAIPCNRKDMAGYLSLVDNVNRFCQFLSEIGFITGENNILSAFYRNIDEQISNKMTATYFNRARDLLSHEIHDVTEIEPKETEVASQDGAKEVLDVTEKTDVSCRPTEISSNLCLFPQCQVSKHVLEVMKLIREILNEAVTGNYSETDQINLFTVAADIVDMYPQFIGLVHKKLIDNLPQIPALVHNNCLYLAHKMATIGCDVKNDHFRFVDLVPRLRKSGVAVLDTSLVKQRDAILGCLAKAGLSSLCDYDKLPESTEKHLNQCLHQLTLLHSVWHNVLPTNVCNRVIGNLSNIFINEVIFSVMKTKDLRVRTAEDLANIFAVIIQEIPSFFPEGEVHRFIKLWLKFKLFVRVLSASLTEIDELWSDGKGPLSMHFSPHDLKSLIKSLFQDTEKREALLMRINL